MIGMCVKIAWKYSWCYMKLTIILDDKNKCPYDCDYYDSQDLGCLVKYCYLPDNGEFTIRKKDGYMIQCPLNKWEI